MVTRKKLVQFDGSPLDDEHAMKIQQSESIKMARFLQGCAFPKTIAF